MNFTKLEITDTFGLAMLALDSELSPMNAFELLKCALNRVDYTIDGIELELYKFKTQCRDGLNKDAEKWADELLNLWVNS